MWGVAAMPGWYIMSEGFRPPGVFLEGLLRSFTFGSGSFTLIYAPPHVRRCVWYLHFGWLQAAPCLVKQSASCGLRFENLFYFVLLSYALLPCVFDALRFAFLPFFSAVLCATVQCSAVLCSAVQCSLVLWP